MKIKVEHWPIARLKKYDRNARLHSDIQVSQIAASIKAFGFVNPVLVDDDGVLIAGHGRLAGAIEAGLEIVPVIKLGHLTDKQAQALRIADNRLPMSATWDINLLRLELNDLSLAGYEMPLLGFDAPELIDFMTAPPPDGADPEKTPEPPVNPTSRIGDLWVLGKHRLLCGDSTKAEDVSHALDGAKPHLMVTDPPYGVEYDPEWRKDRGVNKNSKKLGLVKNDDRADWRDAWALFPGEVVYCWSAGLRSSDVVLSLQAAGFDLRAQIIWAKDRFALGRGDYHFQHEPCWYGVRRKSHWCGSRNQSTLWTIKAREDGGHGHGTQKPIECMRRPIQNNSKPGDFVYEPFSGSGTTIIAAEMMKRCCRAIELSPAYVDVAVKRWQDFAQQKATLFGEGHTFDEITAERSEENNGRKRASIRASRRGNGSRPHGVAPAAKS